MTDILLQNSSGNLIDWTLTNGTFSGWNEVGNPASFGFGVVGTGDYNGDGTSDILLENRSGSLDTWMLHNGVVVSGTGVGNPTTAGYGVVR
jgi:hypothetical protein